MPKFIGPVCAVLILLCAAALAALGDFAVALKAGYGVSDEAMTRIYMAAATAPLAGLYLSRFGLRKIGLGWTAALGGLLILLGFAAAGASEGRLVRLVFGLGVFAGLGAGACLAVCFTVFDLHLVPPMPRALTLAATVGVGSLLASQSLAMALQSGMTLMVFFSLWGLGSGLAILVLAFVIGKTECLPPKIEAS